MGFIEHDPGGKPFAGLIVQDRSCEFKFYLGHKTNYTDVTSQLISAIKKLGHDLAQTSDKLIAANGEVGNLGNLRSP